MFYLTGKNVSYYTMGTRDAWLFKQHFLFSNRLVQLVLRLRSNQNSRNLAFCIIICYILPLAVIQVYELLTINFNLEKTVVEIRRLLEGTIMLLFYSTIYFRNITIKFLLTRMYQDCRQWSHQEELKIMEKYNKDNKLYVYAIAVVFILYTISTTFSCNFQAFLYLIGILDDNQLTLLLPVNNVLNAGLLYYCLLIYQTIGFYILLLIGIASVATYLVIVQHACCQFSIIIWKIQRIFKTDRKYVRKTFELQKKLQDEFNWIVDIIICYRRLTEYVDTINYCSQKNYLLAMLLSMLLLVTNFIYIFQLFAVLQNVPKIIEFCVYITGSLFSIYINFYIGQKFLDLSDELMKELCQIPFYLLSSKTQKILLFVIRRSLKPNSLSVGGLFVSSHEVFSGFMQKAFSFATVYYNIK